MKIHSSVLTERDLYAAVATCPGAWLDRADQKGSRSRARAYDVALESDGTPDANGKPRRRCRNQGKAWSQRDGQHPGFAASYDDWGYFLAHLFAVDAEAIAGPYKSAEDFHAQTADAYRVPRNF